jgi:riboflavin synthase alpha subunit
MTTLADLAPGSSVNLEIDILSRYLLRVQDYRKSHANVIF